MYPPCFSRTKHMYTLTCHDDAYLLKYDANVLREDFLRGGFTWKCEYLTAKQT
jgi:hypothetical protein